MNPQPNILVVDDEKGIRDLLAYDLGSRGYTVTLCEDPKAAIRRLQQEKFNLALSDVMMPQMGGLELLSEIKRIDPNLEVILMTGHASIEMAVEAMKKGAYDFITKPFDMNELARLIEKALEKHELKSLVALYTTAKELFSQVQFDKLLIQAAELSRKVISCDDVSIVLFDEKKEVLAAAHHGLVHSSHKKLRIGMAQRLAQSLQNWDAPITFRNPMKDGLFQGMEEKQDIPMALFCPIHGKNGFWGLWNANRIVLPRAFSNLELQSVALFATQIGQALDNAELYRKLEERVDAYRAVSDQLEAARYKLFQNSRLAAVGQLAAGVAHELNNPLTAVVGYAELLLDDVNDPVQSQEDLKSIVEQAKRCQHIVQNLLQFSREGKMTKQIVDMRLVLDDAIRLSALDVRGFEIAIEKRYSDKPLTVNADVSRLQQVFINILTNARDAMSESPEKKCTVAAEEANGHAVIRVTDTGSGIPKENIARVFDPFFTTKDPGQGTGLGLSISYGIVANHGGTISIESEPSGGTCVIVKLPLVSSSAEKAGKSNGRKSA